MPSLKLMKRKTNKRKTTFESLPIELLTEILAQTASNSSVDFFNAKLSCKTFYEIGGHDYIFQHISIEKFPIIQWRVRKEVSLLLNKCKECGNPEMLYRQGVVDYFSLMETESGLESLTRAARSGHAGALYVVGIISLFSGDESSKQQGVELINGIKGSNKDGSRLRDCREKLRAIVKRIWVRNPIIERGPRPHCCAIRDRHERKSGWESDEDDVQCDYCLCDEEVAKVCETFPNLTGDY